MQRRSIAQNALLLALLAGYTTALRTSAGLRHSSFRVQRNVARAPSSTTTPSASRLNLIPELHDATIASAGGSIDSLMSGFHALQHSLLTADEAATGAATEAVSVYSKVDKTGFIGFFATYIEIAIDGCKNLLTSLGIGNAYGLSIIIFTMIVKVVTLPLITQQLESTTKMQKLAPLQQKIQAKYADDEQTKNQLIAQLFQSANVNPLAGCFPALVQIPLFISLYRALQNLVAEDKLSEGFLWIPSLEGPVYMRPPGESMDWIKSIFTGNPLLGWEDTVAFLSLPLILYVSQTISQKVLQPPKDPNKVLSEQEQFSQGLVNNLPFVVAFFSVNVPAGLAVYWIVNNVLTTLVNISVKSTLKDDGFPPEVDRMMALIDTNASPSKIGAAMGSGSAMQELTGRGGTGENRPKVEGFGSAARSSMSNVVDVEEVVSEKVEEAVGAISPATTEVEGEQADAAEEGAAAAAAATEPSSRKKSKKSKKRRA